MTRFQVFRDGTLRGSDGEPAVDLSQRATAAVMATADDGQVALVMLPNGSIFQHETDEELIEAARPMLTDALNPRNSRDA